MRKNKGFMLSFTKVLCLIALASLAACAPIPIKKDIGSLNFDYMATGASKPTGKVVAIVSPQFAAPERAQATPSKPTLPFGALQTGSLPQPQFNAQDFYEKEYKGRFSTAIMNSTQEIISKKGFTTKGPYAAFEDIPYGDKKDIYLAAVPFLTVYFEQKDTTQYHCKGLVCTDQGEFIVTGEMIYKMIEPLTGQALMARRINLSDFAISKSYIKETESPYPSSSLIGGIIDKATKPEYLRDNTDQMMTQALNEFFKKTMAKIDTFISTEELMSFNNDIEKLKDLKRF